MEIIIIIIIHMNEAFACRWVLDEFYRPEFILMLSEKKSL